MASPAVNWSAACFLLLAVNNLFVVADMLLFTDLDLTAWRQASAVRRWRISG